MIPTIPYLEKKFNLYNAKYFNNKLRKPQFAISNSRNSLGVCITHREYGIPVQYTIKVTKYYDRTEHEVDETLIHEMIHLYIRQFGIIDSSTHGYRFMSEAERINEDGWNIKRLTHIENKQEKITQDKTYYIFIYKCKPTTRNTQFIFRSSKSTVIDYEVYFEDRGIEYKLYETQDKLFDSFTSCRRKILGQEIPMDNTKHKNYERFKKYLIP